MGRKKDQPDNWDFEDIQFSSDNKNVQFFSIKNKNGLWTSWEKITDDSMLKFCLWEMFNPEDHIEC